MSMLLPNPSSLNTEVATSHFPAADRDLLTRLRNAFANLQRDSLRHLRIEFSGPTVVLGGHVGSFHERQLALTCARKILLDRPIVDEIEVDYLPVFDLPDF